MSIFVEILNTAQNYYGSLKIKDMNWKKLFSCVSKAKDDDETIGKRTSSIIGIVKPVKYQIFERFYSTLESNYRIQNDCI